MSGIIESVFFGKKGPTDEEVAARRLQSAKESEIRKKENRENRRRASTAKTLAGSATRQGSLFPSDFAPAGSEQLG